jgi:hypothetical protein
MTSAVDSIHVIFTLLDYLTPIYMPPSQPPSPRKSADDVLLSKMEAGLLPAWVQVQIKVEGTSPPVSPFRGNP